MAESAPPGRKNAYQRGAGVDGQTRRIDTQCCIAGGGPAGLMLGFLLARAGVEVVVLEKHADFLRDFRGDTIHPSTLEILHELGLSEALLALPHDEVRSLAIRVEDTDYALADFSTLPVRHSFIAFMPQWDFLNFIAERAATFPNFSLEMEAEATELSVEEGRIIGPRAAGANGPLEIRADLVVGADGRHSTTRTSARLRSIELGVPIDVLWMRISKRPDDPSQALARIAGGHMLVMIDRGTYWQCAFVIPKGALDHLRARGIDALRQEIAGIAPFTAARLGELETWEDISLLTVLVDRLRHWHRPGFLCIGDAAHAMSPIGGVGINLAIQDAVAAANILAAPLRAGEDLGPYLAKVQRRRAWPARGTQFLQIMIQNNLIAPAVTGGAAIKPPLAFRLLDRWPTLRRIPGRLIGLGLRPEHIR
jgi:2-polyprenyl-6-methoxyphenol hydroxylase-like FAD-dependent oxidoreductase